MLARRRPSVTVSLLFSLLSLLSVQTARGAEALTSPEPRVRLPLHPLGEQGLVLVDVTVGGVARPFLVDTGGGLTVIGPELAPVAGCTPAGRSTGFRSDGGRLDLPRCGPAKLTIGGRERTLEATILDLAALELDFAGVGPTAVQAIRSELIYDGLVNARFFLSHVVTFDLRGATPRAWALARAPSAPVGEE